MWVGVQEVEYLPELEQSAQVRLPGTAKMRFMASGTVSASVSLPPPVLSILTADSCRPEEDFIACAVQFWRVRTHASWSWELRAWNRCSEVGDIT